MFQNLRQICGFSQDIDGENGVKTVQEVLTILIIRSPLFLDRLDYLINIRVTQKNSQPK